MLVARETLTPRMIRVTLRCAGFRDEWPIEQPGEIITLLFVPPEEPIVLPVQGWAFPPDAPPQEWRNYTVRRHRPEAGEIDVDVVLHEPPGPASRWAADVPLGAVVGYAGPRVDYAPRDGIDWLLLCSDETALPAIAAILETPDVPSQVLAVVEIAGAHEELAVDLPAGGELRWVHRDGAPAGTTSHLADALRAVHLPTGAGQSWARPSHGSRATCARSCARSAACRDHTARAGLLAPQRRLDPRRRLNLGRGSAPANFGI